MVVGFKICPPREGRSASKSLRNVSKPSELELLFVIVDAVIDAKLLIVLG